MISATAGGGTATEHTTNVSAQKWQRMTAPDRDSFIDASLYCLPKSRCRGHWFAKTVREFQHQVPVVFKD
jgi:hypothetical protein